jgi:hypothetical protein
VRAVEPQATFFQDDWYIPVEKGRSIRVLTGPRAGAEIKTSIGEMALREWPLSGARIVVVKDTARVLALVEDNPGGIEVHGESLLGVMKKDAKAIGYAPLLAPGGPGKAAQVLDNGVVALFDYEVAEPFESPTISRSSASRTLVPGPPGSQPTSWYTEGESAIVDVYGDHVLVMRVKKEPFGSPEKLLTAVWLRSGKAVELEGSENLGVHDFVPLWGGKWKLPSTPGQATPVTQPSRPPKRCVFDLAVGPQKRLFLCYKPLSEERWAFTAGAQLVTL